MSIMARLIILAVAAMLVQVAMAASYSVGGTNGAWDETTDLKTWASSQTFAVGDNLIFQYAPSHDVMEVTKADYDSCQAGNPIRVYNGGSTSIPLTSPGKRYFICGTPGHCAQGMKMEVDTLAKAASPAASPRNSLATSPAAPPTISPTPEASTISPSPAAGISPLLPPGSPSDSPTDIPSIETPGLSPSSFGSSQQPTSSSANRGYSLAYVTLGLSLMMKLVQIQGI